MSWPQQAHSRPTTTNEHAASADWSNNVQVQRHPQPQPSSAPAVSLHPVWPPTQLYSHAHQQQQQQQQQQRRQHQYLHGTQHASLVVQMSSTSINNGTIQQGMAIVPPQQGRQAQAHPQDQQMSHHPGAVMQSQATAPSQSSSNAVQTRLHPAGPIPPVTQAPGSHQHAPGASNVPTINRTHQAPSTNYPSPEPVEYANHHARIVLQKFGTSFQTLWDAMHNTIATEFLEVNAAYLQEAGKFRNEAIRARDAEQQAREKQENAIRVSEGVLEKAKQWKTCLDETKSKLVALQTQYQLVCKVALRQNKLLQTRKEALLKADFPPSGDSLAIIDYLQKRVADLEHKLQKYEDKPSDTLTEPTSENLGKEYATVVTKSSDIYAPRVVNEEDCYSGASKLQPKSEVSDTTEFVEREPVLESLESVSNAVKSESFIRENGTTLLHDTCSVDSTNIHLEISQTLTSRPSPFHAPSPLNTVTIPLSAGSLSNSLLSHESAKCLPLNMDVLPPTPLSSFNTECRVENANLKRESDDGDGPARKRSRSEGTGFLTAAEFCSVPISSHSRIKHADMISELEAASQASAEDGEIIDGDVISIKASPSGVSSWESLEDGEVPSETTVNGVDVPVGFGEEDLLADTEDSELYNLRMEVLYHRSLKTGEYRCRLCLLEVDAGVIDDKSAVVFPADVARNDMVDHSARAHIQALIGLLQTDRAVLINTIQELYGADTS